MLGKKLGLILAISVTLGVIGAILNYANFLPLLRLENFSHDLRAVMGRKVPVAEDLVFLTIDEASLRLDSVMDAEAEAEPVFHLMKQGWPWPRSVHAAVLDKLIHAGAKVVAFDLLFPSAGQDDYEFSKALRQHSHQAVIGATFDGTNSATPSFSRPSDTLLRPGQDDEMIGFANFVPDSDGIVRSAIFKAAPEDFAERKHLAQQPTFDSLSARILQKSGEKLGFPTGVNLPFRFTGPPGSYIHHSLYEIFVPSFWTTKYQNGAFFRDKIVLIGPEGGWSHDEHPTPFANVLGTSGLMSGPEIHLHALAAARLGEFIRIPGALSGAGIIFLAALVGALLNSLPGSPRKRLLAFGIVIIAYWFAAQIAFDSLGVMLPVATPLLVFALIFLCGFLLEFSRERFERLRSRATLERYVSSDVAKEILDSPESYLTSLVGVRKDVTVLFADLRNFTAMVNLLNAQELVTQLNEFYEEVIEDVFHNSGTLDKIMGDGMMAVWGNLRSDGPKMDCLNAVRTGLAIQASLAELNVRWAEQGRPQLALGIGIAHGECVVGNIGSMRKMDLTVIGEAANLAARLQALTRENLETMLFDSKIARLISEKFTVSTLSTVAIRGFAEPVTLYTVYPE